MNALPIKSPSSPADVVDDLIANFGLRRVLLAVAARMFRKQHPPDSEDFPDLVWQPGVDDLSDHLRRDLGLQPDVGRKIYVDPISLNRHHM